MYVFSRHYHLLASKKASKQLIVPARFLLGTLLYLCISLLCNIGDSPPTRSICW